VFYTLLVVEAAETTSAFSFSSCFCKDEDDDESGGPLHLLLRTTAFTVLASSSLFEGEDESGPLQAEELPPLLLSFLITFLKLW